MSRKVNLIPPTKVESTPCTDETAHLDDNVFTSQTVTCFSRLKKTLLSFFTKNKTKKYKETEKHFNQSKECDYSFYYS